MSLPTGLIMPGQIRSHSARMGRHRRARTSSRDAEPRVRPHCPAVVDAATGKPVACCVYLRDSEGRPVRAGALPFWKDHLRLQWPGDAVSRPGRVFDRDDRGRNTAATGRIRMKGLARFRHGSSWRAGRSAESGLAVGRAARSPPARGCGAAAGSRRLDIAPMITCIVQATTGRRDNPERNCWCARRGRYYHR